MFINRNGEVFAIMARPWIVLTPLDAPDIGLEVVDVCQPCSEGQTAWRRSLWYVGCLNRDTRYYTTDGTFVCPD